MQMEDVISQIELEAPFTALGFFNIELSTMTSIISTVLTYIIVLVQSKPQHTGDPSAKFDHSQWVNADG